jgi:hypothetical protein
MINGTLFVQMLHFFVAYLILKYVLFKPGLAIVMIQEERLLQVQHDIALLKNTVAQEVNRQKQQQAEWSHKAVSLKPDIGGIKIEPFLTMPVMRYTFDPKEQGKVIQESVQQIVSVLGVTPLHKKEKEA